MLRLVVEARLRGIFTGELCQFTATGLDDLEQLAIFCPAVSHHGGILVSTGLLTNLEAESDEAASKDTEQLRLSTIHQAKGLEFDVVFLIMMCDGSFCPPQGPWATRKVRKRSAGCFYVAITRARNELYLSLPSDQDVSGGSGTRCSNPRGFLHEIPKELLEEWDLKTSHRPVRFEICRMDRALIPRILFKAF